MLSLAALASPRQFCHRILNGNLFRSVFVLQAFLNPFFPVPIFSFARIIPPIAFRLAQRFRFKFKAAGIYIFMFALNRRSERRWEDAKQTFIFVYFCFSSEFASERVRSFYLWNVLARRQLLRLSILTSRGIKIVWSLSAKIWNCQLRWRERETFRKVFFSVTAVEDKTEDEVIPAHSKDQIDFHLSCTFSFLFCWHCETFPSTFPSFVSSENFKSFSSFQILFCRLRWKLSKVKKNIKFLRKLTLTMATLLKSEANKLKLSRRN